MGVAAGYVGAEAVYVTAQTVYVTAEAVCALFMQHNPEEEHRFLSSGLEGLCL